MFEINQSVIHCRDGLSTIVSKSNINGKDYFLVRANSANGETIYVPIENAINIIRPIMTSKEADKVLIFIKGLVKEFVNNTKQRRDAYKRRLASGEVNDIAYLYRQLYFYNLIGGEDNDEIKLGPVDIEILSYAKGMLLDELAISYKVDREQTEDFIEKRIKSL